MNIKTYLNQAFHLNGLIEANKQELERLRELAMSIGSPDFSRESVQTSGHVGKIGERVARIVDFEAVINADIDHYIRVQSEIYALINSIEDNRLKLILQKRYLLFEKWEDIALEMGFVDVRNAFYLHKRALHEAAKKKKKIKVKGEISLYFTIEV